jgi:hypothetical protein
VVFAEEAQQRPESTLLENIVPTLRTVTRNIPQRPHSLLADIQYRGRKEFDKFRHCICLDYHLGVLLSAGCDICQSPGGLKLPKESSEGKRRRGKERCGTHLKHRVSFPQELNEARDNTTFNDLFNWWVLLFREKLPEFGRGIKLAFGIIGKNATNHLLLELQGR